MAADPVTPVALITSEIATGGTAVEVVPAGPNGGYITNPADPDDQGIAVTEVLYVSPTGSAPGSVPGDGNGTTFVLYPGQTWNLIPGQTTSTYVNAASTGHKFSGVYW